jgi:hypothetical protein
MLPRPRREEDRTYIKWLREQSEFECLITGSRGSDVDACHLKSRGAGGSDYFCFPLLHSLHVELDHSPRGSTHTVREARLRDEQALWFYSLPILHQRYFESHPMKASMKLDTYAMMREVCHSGE